MKGFPALEEGPARDGRVRRGERSRQAIVAALFELVGSGIVQPTAQQVASRAGVGLRSVFRHFSEIDSLYAAMDATLLRDAVPIIGGGNRTGDLEERGRKFVLQRVMLFEKVAPFKRSANLQRWRSPFLEERHQRMQRALHDDLLLWLPELGAAPADLVAAVDNATAFETWDRLRFDRSLSRKVATAAVTRTVLALLRDCTPAKRTAL